MGHFLTFLQQHLLLVSAFFILLFALLSLDADGNTDTSPKKLITLMNNHGARVYDIRSPDSFAQGHLINSQSISSESLVKKFSKGNKNKDLPIVLVCESGKEARSTVSQLKKIGFNNVSLLSGGIEEWKKQNLPLVAS